MLKDVDVPVSICAEAEETIYVSDPIRGKAARRREGRDLHFQADTQHRGKWHGKREATSRPTEWESNIIHVKIRGRPGRKASSLLTTPHAPWTPNWRQNAPAAKRALNELGRIQRGMKAISREKVRPYPRDVLP